MFLQVLILSSLNFLVIFFVAKILLSIINEIEKRSPKSLVLIGKVLTAPLCAFEFILKNIIETIEALEKKAGISVLILVFGLASFCLLAIEFLVFSHR